MKINRVTVTGADDSIRQEELIKISEEFPYVEWGILVHKGYSCPRFPSWIWMDRMKGLVTPTMQFSCHVCGKWVRDICFEGVFDPELLKYIGMFQRIQLNFHAIVHKIDQEKFLNELYLLSWKQYIFQLDDVNNEILDIVQKDGLNAVPLFDTSGGAGVLPGEWPTARGYCGYAGGLSPENLKEQLKHIEEKVGDATIWIDAETQLRSENDMIFEPDKVRQFLEVAAPYVEARPPKESKKHED